jgi:tetratricopeptide (TPR) repeat protein
MLKALIAANYPVIIETGEMFEAYDWIGHYRTLVAYDDILGVFYAYDSFLGISNGEGVTIPYREQDERWKAFNRVFIVLYPPQDEQKVAAILGPLYDEQSANEHAFAVAQNEARQNPQDAFAWFNMGSSLAALGRYEEAARAYDRARQIGELPWRMLWYQFGVFEAYFNVGRYDDIIALAQANLNNSPELEESYYWQGRALAAQGKTTEAATAFRAALRRNPRYEAARIALDGLPG